MEIKKIEIGQERRDSDRQSWCKVYKVVTISYYPSGYDTDIIQRCGEMYPGDGRDDRLSDMMIGGQEQRLSIKLEYKLDGIIYDNPVTLEDFLEKKEQKIKNAQKEIEEYKESSAKNGLCPKCHTYCYGDCEAN